MGKTYAVGTPSNQIVETNTAFDDVLNSGPVTEQSVAARLRFLSSDALAGRGSGTRDEWITAAYIASEFEAMGLEPAGGKNDGDGNDYIQTILLGTEQPFAGTDLFKNADGSSLNFTYSQDYMFANMTDAQISGAIKLVDLGNKASIEAIQDGDIVVWENRIPMFARDLDQYLLAMKERGAVAVMMPTQNSLEWLGSVFGETPAIRTGESKVPFLKKEGMPTTVMLSVEALDGLRTLGNGHQITLGGELSDDIIEHKTWNVFGKLPGTDPDAGTVFITSHLDHLGIKDDPWNDSPDKIYNGANDDASGTVAVMELADVISADGPDKRSVVFGAFGSEEAGLIGSQKFVENPTVPLGDALAMLQFEMLARIPDGYDGALSFTGFDRSNLGAQLNEWGANLKLDERQWENFFKRSDNYSFAFKGIPGHTIIFDNGVRDDEHYHKPSDDMSNANTHEMTKAINSVVEPIIQLLNSDYVPEWYEGKNPEGQPRW